MAQSININEFGLDALEVFYTRIKDQLGQGGIELTSAEYNALTDAQKNNNQTYYIKDLNSDINQPITEISQVAYDALSAANKNNGTIYVITDKDLNVIHAPQMFASGYFTPKGEIALASLPSSATRGDYYYITDKYEGRYYNGSVWQIVK